MKNYSLELSIVLDDHGLGQALGLQAKTGKNKSKILKMYAGYRELINNDGSVSANDFAGKTVRINLIGHGAAGSDTISDTGAVRSWTAERLADDVRKAVEWALPKRVNKMFQRLSFIVCYGGGHTYTTQNEYGHHIHPRDSFGFKFFKEISWWVTDMTARGDVSITRTFTNANAPQGTLNHNDFTGAIKVVGDDKAHKDRYRKVRFYREGDDIKVEWPYLGYD